MKSALQTAAGGRAATTSAPGVPPVRVGKRQIAGFFLPEVGKQLRVMAAENTTTVQALLTEALNDLYRKHGRPPIA
jgi:hypothetical protein